MAARAAAAAAGLLPVRGRATAVKYAFEFQFWEGLTGRRID